MGNALIIYGILMVGMVAAAVLWGLKTGQFGKQEDAGHLPFEVEDKVDDDFEY